MDLSKFYKDFTTVVRDQQSELLKTAAIGALTSGLGVMLINGKAQVALTAMAMSLSTLALSIIGKAANMQLKLYKGDAGDCAVTALSLAAVRFCVCMFNPNAALTHFLFSSLISSAIQLNSGAKPGIIIVV